MNRFLLHHSIRREWLASHRTLWLCGTAALCMYLGIAWFVLDPHTIWSPDEGAKLLQMYALHIEAGTLHMHIPYAGNAVDPDLQFAHWAVLTIRDGALSFGRLPIFPLLTHPWFVGMGDYGLYVLPALGGALVGVLTLCLLPPAQRQFTTWLLIAFGSPVLIYATTFWEHTLSTSLVLAGSVLLLHQCAAEAAAARRGRDWSTSLVVVGLFALGVYMRAETIIFVLALLAACWFLTPSRRWYVFWTGGLTALVLLPYIPLHQMLLAGQALPDNALYVFMPFAYLQHAGLQAIPDLFIGPPIEEAIDTGWIGWVWAGTALVAIGCGVCPPTRVVGGVLVAALIVTICAASVFLWTPAYYRSAHGLLFTTPWAIIGLCRTRDLWCCGSHRIRILVLTVVLGLFLYALAILVLRGSSPHGGLQWGARFALTFYAPLAILALWRWNCTPPRRILHTAMLVLCILGLGFQLRGLGIIAIDKHYNGTLNAAIATTAPHYVVSDLPWLPLNAAPIYAQKTWFVTSTPAEFEDWLTRAAALPVSEFSIVTNRDTQLFARAGQLAAQHEFHITTVETMVGATVVFHVEQAAPAGRLIE